MNPCAPEGWIEAVHRLITILGLSLAAFFALDGPSVHAAFISTETILSAHKTGKGSFAGDLDGQPSGTMRAVDECFAHPGESKSGEKFVQRRTDFYESQGNFWQTVLAQSSRPTDDLPGRPRNNEPVPRKYEHPQPSPAGGSMGGTGSGVGAGPMPLPLALASRVEMPRPEIVDRLYRERDIASPPPLPDGLFRPPRTTSS